MEEKERIIALYNLYGNLLSETSRYNFEDYYLNNLSLSEIAENSEVSRTAIHKSIKATETKLNYYEDKLKIYEKKNKLLEILDKSNLDQDKINELF